MFGPIASRLLLRSILSVLAAVAFRGQLGAGDQPQKDQAEEARRGQQLDNMQRSAAQYVLSSADTPERAFKFHDSPLMRFSNPITGTKDGALYGWTDHGRPQALLKFFSFDNKTYSHFWLSLSEDAFLAKREGQAVWTPSNPGIEWRELPDSPQPAATPAERLRQMKALSARFSATYIATHLRAKPFDLRLLTQPLLRYETEDNHADGALFGFVQSTTPVGLLLLESRQTEVGPRWHYAYGALVTGPVTARYQDKEVFSLERNAPGRDPNRPYALFHSLPVPKK
jgi:hypothetical protein